jgi:predicted metalloendopeptidase
VTRMAEQLDERYVDAYLAYNRFATGIPQRPLKRRCMDFVLAHLDRLVDRVYIRHYFDLRMRNEVGVMFSRLRDSFRQIISKSYWLDEGTKRVARDKLEEMRLVVGFTDSIYNDTMMDFIYGGLDLREGGSLACRASSYSP